MDIVQAVLLGLIQGIAEWLPISSQGQVIIVSVKLFGISAEAASKYAIFLHIGTLIAAIAYFRKEIIKILKLEEIKLGKFMLIAVLATAITALPSYILLKKISGSTFLIVLGTGLFLILTGVLQMANKKEKSAEQNKKNAFFLGLGQGFSVLPGVSRSGITTSVLLFEGFKPKDAFKLSFMLSIPSVLAAEILFGATEGIYFEFNVLIAIAVAAVLGFVLIDFLIKAARRINFALFCIGFGIFYIALAFL